SQDLLQKSSVAVDLVAAQARPATVEARVPGEPDGGAAAAAGDDAGGNRRSGRVEARGRGHGGCARARGEPGRVEGEDRIRVARVANEVPVDRGRRGHVHPAEEHAVAEYLVRVERQAARGARGPAERHARAGAGGRREPPGTRRRSTRSRAPRRERK